MAKESWTAKQLIEELSKFDPEAEVFTEGCDCFGNVCGVSVQFSDGGLLIERSN